VPQKIAKCNCKVKVKVVGSRPTAGNGGVTPAPFAFPGFFTARYRTLRRTCFSYRSDNRWNAAA